MSTEICKVCDEHVNPDEQLSADGVWYHDTCFKCSQCDEKLLENNYSSLDGILYCKAHFDQKFEKNTRLPRGLSLPKPSELLNTFNQRKTSSRLSSFLFKTQATQAKQTISKPPPAKKREVPQTISVTNDDGAYTSHALTTINQSINSHLDQDTIMNLVRQNPALYDMLAGFSNQTEIETQDFLKKIIEQLTQNPEMMNLINQLGQHMDGNQDLGSTFAAMSCSNANDNLDMSLMFQQMMPFFSQALDHPASSSNLLEHNPPKKHDLHRRCYSDSASLNCLSMDCQMNLKEAVQKIEEEYPALEIFSSIVESAALSQDNVYDVYGLADLCSEEELAQEFMEMLKHDVCRRLGKRYDRCSSVS